MNFCKSHSVETASLDSLDEERIQTDIENDLRDQIAHNVRAGVLKAAANDEVKYSWRGMIYLWCQFLLDLVRFITLPLPLTLNLYLQRAEEEEEYVTLS